MKNCNRLNKSQREILCRTRVARPQDHAFLIHSANQKTQVEMCCRAPNEKINVFKQITTPLAELAEHDRVSQPAFRAFWNRWIAQDYRESELLEHYEKYLRPTFWDHTLKQYMGKEFYGVEPEEVAEMFK